MMSDQSGIIGKVKRQPLANQTADLLRASIEQGKLVPGTRLIEAKIAKEMGVSRGILREALRMLEQEYLLESHPGRGTYVACLSERDVREIYSLRRILEGEAARLAAPNATSADIAELESILEAMVGLTRQGARTKVIEKDLEFHRKIWEMADHVRLKNLLEGFSIQIAIFLRVNTDLPQDLIPGRAGYRLLLDSIRNKDGDTAAKHMINGLDIAAEQIINAFK